MGGVAPSSIFGEAKRLLKKARYFYRLAKWQIYEELFFQSEYKKYSNLNINIKSLNDSFKTTGRLDSEYYQAKFETNENFIKSIKYARLGEIVNIKKSIEPGSEAYKDKGVEFIRVANLNKFEISKSDIFLEYTDDMKKLYPKKDTILLSKDGTIGTAYCVKNDLECVTSGALLHLNIKDKDISPEYLTLVLNSILVSLQAQKDAGGSIISHWKTSQIEQVLIPIVDKILMKKIEGLLKESFGLRKKSKELLEIAKAKLEKTINEI